MPLNIFRSHSCASLLTKIILLSLLILNAINLYSFNVDYSGFITGDWLINYEGGFIRRGLSGQIILELFNLTHIPPWILVWCIQMALYAAIYFFAAKKITRAISPIALVFFASPVSFFFEFHDPGILGRKELAFIAMMAANGWALDSFYKSKPLDFRYYLILSISTALCILNHEVAFFYIPVLYLQLICFRGIDKSLLFYTPLLTAFLAFFLVYTHPGSTKEFEEIIQSIKEFWYIPADCDRSLGAICYIKSNAQGAVSDAIQPGFHLSFIMAALIILSHSIVFLMIIGKPRKFYSKAQSLAIGLLLTLAIIFVFPLFFVAVDYGRWIRLFVIGLFFSIPTVLLKDQEFKTDNFRPIIFGFILLLSASWSYTHTRSSNIEFGIWSKQEDLWNNLYKRLEKTKFKTAGTNYLWEACKLPTRIGTITPECEIRKGDIAAIGPITYGPYERLPAGQYAFEIAYSSTATKADTVGDWDVVLALPQEAKVLKNGPITGSDEATKKISGEFAIDSEYNMDKIEIRTLARQNYDLKIIYIRLERRE